MAEHRRYTKREKVSAVTAAVASSVTAAAEAYGIPKRTLGYWMERPEFAQLRTKTREDLARGFELLAHRAQEELMLKLSDMEPRDLTVLVGVATDKSQLLSGHATSRTESKALSDSLTDHEKELFRDAIDRLSGEPAAEGEGGAEVGAGAEVRQ